MEHLFARGAVTSEADFPREVETLKHLLPFVHGYLIRLAKERGSRILPGAGIRIITAHGEANR